MKAQAKILGPVHEKFMGFRYLWHTRAAKDKASLNIRIVSPEPSLIALKRSDVDESSGYIVYTSLCNLGAYRMCKQRKTRRACTFAQSLQIMLECFFVL